MMDEPKFAQPIPNVTVAGNCEKFWNDLRFLSVIFFQYFTTVGRDANLPCVVEHLGTYKVSRKCGIQQSKNIQYRFIAERFS